MKRSLSIILTFLVASTVMLTGCKKNGPAEQATGNSEATGNVTPAGQLPIVKDKITITAYAEVDPTLDMTQNEALKKIEEQTNIHLDIVAKPGNSADVATQKNLLLASNDYPEIFITGDKAAFSQMEMIKYGVKDKIFIPLNDYIDKYSFELKKIFAQRPEYKKIMVAPDNNIYAISRISESYHSTANPKFWVNYDWMNKLGIKEPQNLDDLYNMLKAFKEKDPNGNGRTDEIPVTTASDELFDSYIVNSFIPYNKYSNYCFLDNNGKVVFAGNTPEFREAVRYMRKLYKDGLLDIAAFSQTRDQMAQTIRKEPFTVGGYMASHMGIGIDNKNEKAMAAYHALPPVKGPQGVGYQARSLFVNFNIKGYFMITDKCKNPEAAFRLADYFLNVDVSNFRYFGKEGVDWKKPQAGIKNMAGGDYKIEVIPAADDNAAKEAANRKFSAGPYLGMKEVRDTWQPQVTGNDLNLAKNYESRLQMETDKLTKYFYPKELPTSIFMSQDETEQFNEMNTNITNHLLKSLAQFVVGDRNIDADWDAYVNEMKNFKVDSFVQLYQKAYDRYKTIK